MENMHIYLGILYGIVTNIAVNVSIIAFIYDESFAFLPAFFCCSLASLLLKSDNWKKFFISVLSAFFSFLAVDFSFFGGMMAVIHYIGSIAFFIIGVTIAFIFTALKIRRHPPVS